MHFALLEEVSRNALPAPRLRSAADAIVANLTQGGAAFNGVHLQTEQHVDVRSVGAGDEARAWLPVPPPPGC